MGLRSRVRACTHALGPVIAAAKRVRASTHPTDLPIFTIKDYLAPLIATLFENGEQSRDIHSNHKEHQPDQKNHAQ